MKVVRAGINKMRIQKTRMPVIPRRLNVLVESCHGRSRLFPCTRVRSGSTVIDVVIDSDRRLVLFYLRSVQRYEAARPRVDDVVLKNIVRHVPLHLKLTGPRIRRIVFVERVVDHRAVIGVPSLRSIASDGNTRGVAVIDQIVSRSDVAGSAVLVLAGQLDSKIHIVHDVLLDQDPGAAIHVNTIGVYVIAVGRIALRCNVVNQIAAYNPVAGLVDGRVGRRALETDYVDSNIVVVVDHIVRNAEVDNVPVHDQRLARAGLEMMHLIAVDHQLTDWSLGVGTVYSNAKPVGTVSRTITSVKSLLNMMDIVLQQFNMGAGAHDAYAQWSEAMLGGAEIANFKSFDPHVTLVMNGQYAASAVRNNMPCVEDGRLARITSKRNVSIRRIARCLDVDELFVDSTAHVDGRARPHGVRGMLNGAPRCRFGAGIRIIPGRRHIERGVGLAIGHGDAGE